MAAVVERVGGEARRGEPGGDVAIAPGVLTDAMSDVTHDTGMMQIGNNTRLTMVNFQSINSSTTTAPMIVIGCLNTSLLTLARACCMLRVSLAIRDMR